MKRCSTCKELKQLSEFHRNKRSKDGHVGECKSCKQLRHKRRYKGEVRERQLKQQRERYQNNLEVRKAKAEYIRKYRNDPKVKDAHAVYNKQYRKTKKGKEVHKKSHKKYWDKHHNRLLAKLAVNYAVMTGKLPHVSTHLCADCKEKTAENYHHWSYKREHRLDVIPLCRQCHVNRHKVDSRSPAAFVHRL